MPVLCSENSPNLLSSVREGTAGAPVKSSLRRGGKTREDRRDSFPRGFWGSGLAGTVGVTGFGRTYWQNLLVILHFAIAYAME